MPCLDGAEMPDDRQPYVVINIVKSSAMNNPEYLKKHCTAIVS